jgi:DNA-directed RNA polymerase specialized sigma24 family protein
MTTKIGEIELEYVIPRLLLFTSRLLRNTTLPHLSPDDFVQAAILKTLDGTRPWNSKEIKLLPHLMGIVKSDVSHSITRAQRHKAAPIDEIDVDYIIDLSDDVEKKTLETLEAEKFLDAHKKSDPELAILASRILTSEFNSAEQLAKSIGISISELNNRKKRLNREMRKYAERAGKVT